MSILPSGQLTAPITGLDVRNRLNAYNAGFENTIRLSEMYGVKSLPWVDIEDPTDHTELETLMTAAGIDPVANLAAVQALIDWSSENGGVVLLQPGTIPISGTLINKSYCRIEGCGHGNTAIRQMQVPTVEGDPWTTVVATPTAAQGGSERTEWRNLRIDGGWNRRNYIGAVFDPNWWYDPANMNQRGFLLDTAESGPSGTDRRFGGADPHHRLENVWIANVAGTGIEGFGRGEYQLEGLKINNCHIGIDFATSFDNWITDCTIASIGETAVVIRNGNLRMSQCKLWFTGLMNRTEPTWGAGFVVVGAGNIQLNLSTVTTQDTWGPGFILEGDSHSFYLGVDEAGGGRLEEQGLGYTGSFGGLDQDGTNGGVATSRTDRRCAIRVNNLQGSVIRVAYSGGARNGTDNFPLLVEFSGSGADLNHIEITTGTDTFDADYIRIPAGLVNAKRWNRILVNGREILGQVSAADLADADHSVNHPTRGPSKVTLDDQRTAELDSNGDWKVSAAPATTITPVAP